MGKSPEFMIEHLTLAIQQHERWASDSYFRSTALEHREIIQKLQQQLQEWERKRDSCSSHDQ